MNHEQIIARNAKELETIKRKVAAMVKKAGCSVGEIRWSEHERGWWVEVDNDGELSDEIVSIVNAAPTARVVSHQEFKGQYDWSSDTYIRPCSAVHLKF